MADFFISYAKESRGSAEWLAGALSGRGYSVWWDTSLVAGRSFRDAILRELDDARAVIVIWTPYSVSSNWVIAEADRALSMGKLIPVMADGVQTRSIPMPFGVLHTVDFTNIGAIEQASAVGNAYMQIWRIINEKMAKVLEERGQSLADLSQVEQQRIRELVVKGLREEGVKF